MTRSTFVAGISSLLMAATLSTGCSLVQNGPMIPLPMPVSALKQKAEEDEAWVHERYARVPILGPFVPGGPMVAMDPPSDDEVMRALERARPVQGGVPFLWEKHRNNVQIVKAKIADYVDPPRHIPMIGPAQLHHAHYKCTVYFTETKHVGWPAPHTIKDEDTQEVIYIDHNHFHMVGNVDTGATSNF